MIHQYIKIAFRNLVKYKAQSIINILGIAIGFTAFILGGYWYYWEHNFDTFHPDWKHTYAITTTGISQSIEGDGIELNQLHERVRKHFETFPEIEVVANVTDTWFVSDKNEGRWIGLNVSPEFFKLFTCKLLEGTYEGKPYDDRQIVLTKRAAERAFGTSSCIGKVLEVTETKSFTVVAVMDDYQQNTDFKFDFLILSDNPLMKRTERSLVYVGINKHANIKELKERITKTQMDFPRFKKSTEMYTGCTYNLRSLPEVHLFCSHELLTRFRNIKILAYAGLFAFISALMNLLVCYIGQQQRKTGIHLTFKTLGASKYGLIIKCLMELLLPLFFAFILTLVLLEIVLPYYQNYTQLTYDGTVYSGAVNRITGKEITYAGTILYLSSSFLFLLLSLVPTILLIKKKDRIFSIFLRNGLITSQIFIGALFLVGSLGFYSQFRFIVEKDKGIVVDNIWQIDIGYETAHSPEGTAFREALKNSSYIEETTFTTYNVLSANEMYYGNNVVSLKIEREQETIELEKLNSMLVHPNFFSFFGLNLKEGKWPTDTNNLQFVFNEAVAKKAGIKELSETKVYYWHDVATVVGIISDYHYCPMQYPIDAVAFKLRDPIDDISKDQYFYAKISPQNKEKALKQLKLLYKEFDNGEVNADKQILYLPDIMEEFNRPEKTMFTIFLILAIATILISTFGIYSLVSLSAEQRRKEIAIRKVNGALYRDVLSLFLKEYVWLVFLANAIALPLGYLFLSRWLETYAYHADLNIWLFIGVFVITCAVVIFSVARQVMFAVKINPAEVVKSE